LGIDVPGPLRVPARSGETVHVLVVDHDPETRELLAEPLIALGYRVTTAQDEREAWARIDPGGIDLVITDWTLPGVDGVELCRRIRARGDDPYTYVILVTAKTDVGDVVSALASGADEVLRKPVAPFELATRIESIDRLRELHRKVAEQNRELLEAQQFKNDWIHMIVHDLRTPLAVIQGSCELIQMAPDRDHGKRLDTMIGECERVLGLLEQMLIAAKSEAGQLSPSLEDVDPAAILASARKAAGPIAEQRGIRIVIEAHLEGRCARLDRSLFRRAVDNLLSNAIKYGAADSVVTVTASWDTRNLVVDVADEGAGVPEKDRVRLFERFATLASTRDVPQIGLGLAFCRMVAESHGGTICCEPREPRGSIFRLRLPVGVPKAGKSAKPANAETAELETRSGRS
jgi:signal transduction histidine kinase